MSQSQLVEQCYLSLAPAIYGRCKTIMRRAKTLATMGMSKCELKSILRINFLHHLPCTSVHLWKFGKLSFYLWVICYPNFTIYVDAYINSNAFLSAVSWEFIAQTNIRHTCVVYTVLTFRQLHRYIHGVSTSSWYTHITHYVIKQ